MTCEHRYQLHSAFDKVPKGHPCALCGEPYDPRSAWMSPHRLAEQQALEAAARVVEEEAG